MLALPATVATNDAGVKGSTAPGMGTPAPAVARRGRRVGIGYRELARPPCRRWRCCAAFAARDALARRGPRRRGSRWSRSGSPCSTRSGCATRDASAGGGPGQRAALGSGRAARAHSTACPVTLKENLARRGVPMPSGNAGVEPVVPQHDAPGRPRGSLEAGGVIIGSTVMPDWGMLSSGVSSRHGITRSPWNPDVDHGRLQLRRRCRGRRRVRPAPRRHRHRRLDPAAGHLAGPGDAQAQRRPGARWTPPTSAGAPGR